MERKRRSSGGGEHPGDVTVGGAADRTRADDVANLRAANRPTVPMTLAQEKATNPFLRAPNLKATIGLANAPDWEAFAALRKMKDNFR